MTEYSQALNDYYTSRIVVFEMDDSCYNQLKESDNIKITIGGRNVSN